MGFFIVYGWGIKFDRVNICEGVGVYRSIYEDKVYWRLEKKVLVLEDLGFFFFIIYVFLCCVVKIGLWDFRIG